MAYSKNSIEVFENSISDDVCKEIIRRFEADNRKTEGGLVYGDGTTGTDTSLKKCTELYLTSLPEWKDIDEFLYKEVSARMNLLRDENPGLAQIGTVNDEGYRIKKYENDGTEFFDWHIDGNGAPQGRRYLIFQWYLNDVEEGGETEFRLQETSVKPVAGRLVCFPPFWTHEHRGVAPVSEPKYILCTWITF